MELRLFEQLREAYGRTTRNHNYFKDTLDAIGWDSIFTADDEQYYVKGDMIVTVENTNPFEEAYKPTVIFPDGSYMEF